ncbi:hypothetical protein BAUCODRAFT_565346 [Baudoinia panamericana UAMH 10762]|uniref:Uncharacterized protein n=1 Tax=Baudoinia panamericana (strain UAMH 10762) TaxID=717646 RepID=M2ME72_BAUPA|nr:uncharacterized protein BAUCODRAFT_565346 [Baudoinia panamericana UAMH 10762]EMC94881.1 hypothetical protein BAUCODRAFT_565346 [Baudoinia panamericana UAMH 10762]
MSSGVRRAAALFSNSLPWMADAGLSSVYRWEALGSFALALLIGVLHTVFAAREVATFGILYAAMCAADGIVVVRRLYHQWKCTTARGERLSRCPCGRKFVLQSLPLIVTLLYKRERPRTLREFSTSRQDIVNIETVFVLLRTHRPEAPDC